MVEVRFRYDSYCGIYCGACDTLLATERGCLSVLAREWHRTVGDLRCHGCKSTVNSVFCRDCLIRRRARSRNRAAARALALCSLREPRVVVRPRLRRMRDVAAMLRTVGDLSGDLSVDPAAPAGLYTCMAFGTDAAR